LDEAATGARLGPGRTDGDFRSGRAVERRSGLALQVPGGSRTALATRLGIGPRNHPDGKGGDLMTRGIPSHPVLAAMLALALLVGLGLPASAAPNTVVGTGDSVTVTESLAAIDGPGHHFGFSQSSVLAQLAVRQSCSRRN